MTTSTAIESAADAAPQSAERSLLTRLAETLHQWCDRANPILVKETRQALKSREFVVTFFVTLIACWIVTFVGVAWIGPQILYGAAGPQMLTAYYMTLAVPLTLAVPASAYRSLSAEREDNTLELLTITALSPRQIVAGKLLSAAVQMLIYVCAVGPCLGFSVLLRGVNGSTIAVLLLLVVLASLGLSALALLTGAVARARRSQSLISIVQLLASVATLAGAWGVVSIVAGDGLSQLSTGAWWIISGAAMAYVTTFGLVMAAAAAQLSFASDNRSTALRRWMTLQQACLCGFLGSVAFEQSMAPRVVEYCVSATICLGALYWFLMGGILAGEWPHLSSRIRRSLPATTASRLLGGLYVPGPASGHYFAVAHLTALVLFAAAILALRARIQPLGQYGRAAACTAVFAWSYSVFYLAIGKALTTVARKWTYVSQTAAFLIHVVAVLTGVGLPTVFQFMSPQLRSSGYSLLQISNPFWTVAELLLRGPGAVDASILVWILPTAAIVGLSVNLPTLVAELRQRRVPLPQRVAEDDQRRREETLAAMPASPWDEPAAAIDRDSRADGLAAILPAKPASADGRVGERPAAEKSK